MKKAFLFNTIGLSLLATLSFGGIFAVANAKTSRPANAEGEKTWMFRAQLNLAACSPNYGGCVFPEDKPVDGVKFHYWGDNVNETVDAGYMCYQSYDYYGVNISLRDDQKITGAQWILHQVGEGDKYSVDITKFGKNSDSFLDKTNTVSDNLIIQWQFVNEWVGDKWEFLEEAGTVASYLRLTRKESDAIDFVRDPLRNRLIASNAEVVANQWVGMENDGNVQIRSAFKPMLDEDSAPIASGGANHWFYLTKHGTFDVIINSYNISFKYYEDKYDTYIYYVTNSSLATTDYIYSWGGSEQFGAFPGKAITSITNVEELTGNGVVHFQGGNAKLIYKIPISTGYPEGDAKFMFNNGTSEYKSDERLIENEQTYWWTGAANNNATEAIKFLKVLEARRNEVADYSVCNILPANASFLVNLYNGYSQEIRETYIDCSTIYTWKDISKTENELVSVRKIMEQLSEIGNVALVNSSRITLENSLNTNALFIIIVLTSILSISGLGVYLYAKKRKMEK